MYCLVLTLWPVAGCFSMWFAPNLVTEPFVLVLGAPCTEVMVAQRWVSQNLAQITGLHLSNLSEDRTCVVFLP